MKIYTITLEYQNPDRDTNGIPVFGTITIDVKAFNIESAKKYLTRIFGIDHYNIKTITESIVK